MFLSFYLFQNLNVISFTFHQINIHKIRLWPLLKRRRKKYIIKETWRVLYSVIFFELNSIINCYHAWQRHRFFFFTFFFQFVFKMLSLKYCTVSEREVKLRQASSIDDEAYFGRTNTQVNLMRGLYSYKYIFLSWFFFLEVFFSLGHRRINDMTQMLFFLYL